jgi:hypothetical protein
LPAIAGYVPDQMVQAIAAFMDFCYIVRQYSFDEEDLIVLQDALERFETHRSIFQACGIRPSGISIPHIHALQHYKELIQLFGAPNGLCSSLTESKHITAIKKPYRHSNHNDALNQILIINQRLDNLSSYRNAYVTKGILLFYISFRNNISFTQFILIRVIQYHISTNRTRWSMGRY